MYSTQSIVAQFNQKFCKKQQFKLFSADAGNLAKADKNYFHILDLNEKFFKFFQNLLKFEK